LEVSSGSGDIQVDSGPAGQVRIHGEYQVMVVLFDSVSRRVEQLREHPPIEQRENVIQVGLKPEGLRNVTINYRITVPAETMLRAQTGSGDIQVRGIKGPLRLHAGSGDVTAENIGDEVEAGTGSGDVSLVNVSGPVTANTGSGDLRLANVKGGVRAKTGSGSVRATHPGGRLQATTGSGEVDITGASGDLRLNTGSGDVTISGNPVAHSYWDLRTSSGEISIDVPESASFRLYARASSGSVTTSLPVVIEEKSRRVLRGRVGNGDGRIEAETSSGGIRIR
jgi:DUF4097 and DUF4098 domain-containing protein YvlB